jgi:FtsH-binding integral membrane protein
LNSHGHFALANSGFALQSESMEPKWAEENLQTIRTLMERSAVYRRALAPIMMLAGVTGLLTMAIGLLFQMDSARQFCSLWFCAAVVAVTGAFLLARRQALKDREPFWSSPTRRVTEALLPPLAAGFCASALVATFRNDLAPLISFVWILFYGCAL